MPRNYFKLDLYFFEHPKVVDLCHSAMVLFLASIAYSNRRETDGFIARPVVRKLIDLDWHGQDVPSHDELAVALVKAELWEPVEGGWRIHDFFDHNDSSEERAAKRVDDRDRKRRERAGKTPSGHVTAGQNGASENVTEDMSQRPKVSRPIEVEVEVAEQNREKINTVVEFAAPHGATTRPVSVADTRQVFDEWNASLPPGTQRRLTEARRKAIQARLREFGLKDCLDAAVGWRNDPWEGRAEQNDIIILFRPSNFERMRDFWRHGPPVRAAPLSRTQTQLYATDAALARWAEEVDNHAGNGVAGDRRPPQCELARPADPA